MLAALRAIAVAVLESPTFAAFRMAAIRVISNPAMRGRIVNWFRSAYIRLRPDSQGAVRMAMRDFFGDIPEDLMSPGFRNLLQETTEEKFFQGIAVMIQALLLAGEADLVVSVTKLFGFSFVDDIVSLFSSDSAAPRGARRRQRVVLADIDSDRDGQYTSEDLVNLGRAYDACRRVCGRDEDIDLFFQAIKVFGERPELLEAARRFR